VVVYVAIHDAKRLVAPETGSLMATIELKIELGDEQRPIRGRILEPHDKWRSFDGYLELMAALDRIVDRGNRGEPNRPPPESGAESPGPEEVVEK
jgi:hypothetical protein